MNLNVHLYSELSPEQREGMDFLFRYLDPVLERYPAPYLDSVHVVPSTSIVGFVNGLIEGMGGPANAYQGNPEHPSSGVAVPLEGEGVFACFVVLAQGLFDPLTADAFLPFDTVSTVLEEFLHCHFYCAAWDRRGHVNFQAEPDRPCEERFRAVAGMGMDEYLVGRTKASLLEENPLVNCEGGATTCRVYYGGSVDEALRSGAGAMRRIISDVARGRTAVQDGGDALFSALYRGLVEPLCRSAGPLDAYGELREGEAVAGATYGMATSRLWKKLHKGLRLAFDRPDETEGALDSCVAALIEFASAIGVTCSSDGAGGCYLHFQSAG